jgi:predicted nucleic acid binding AN1-type Zn finger protein
LELYGFKVAREECCGRAVRESIISYWDYYNFYFCDYLKKRSKHQCTFLDSEVWHIV